MLESAPRGGVVLKGLFCLAGAGVTALTLMACYGMPPCDMPPPEGSTDPFHCYDHEPPCHVALPDGGTDSSQCAGDAGTQPTDGGVHDGGH